MNNNRLLAFIALLFLFLPVIFAQPQQTVLINSNSWTDIYSGIHYADSINAHVYFFVDAEHAKNILTILDPNDTFIVLESKSDPMFVNYATLLTEKGYEVTTKKMNHNEFHFELLNNRTTHIIVDNRFGYDAISVGPYASLTNATVLFIDQNDLQQVEEFIEEHPQDAFILYGAHSRALKNLFNTTQHTIIDQGSRFDDNIAIVDRFLQTHPTGQVFFTNGNFLESELVTGSQGNHPILFVGKNSVPEQIKNYATTLDIKVGVLFGPSLVTTAKVIKDITGINVLVKFGKTGYTRSPEFQKIRGLDTFPLPNYAPTITIDNIMYTPQDNQVHITFTNPGAIPVYFSPSLKVIDANQQTLSSLASNLSFLEAQQTITESFPIKLATYFADENIPLLEILILFGESLRSLENIYQNISPIVLQTENLDASCNAVTLEQVMYSTNKQRFYVEVANPSLVNCHTTVTLQNVIVNDNPTNVGSKSSSLIPSESSQYISVKQRLDEVDIEDNKQVTVNIYSGSNSNVLLHKVSATLPVHLGSPHSSGYLIISIVIALIVAILLLLKFKRKQRPHKQHNAPHKKKKKSTTS